VVVVVAGAAGTAAAAGTFFNENIVNRKATFDNQASKTKYTVGLNGVHSNG